MRQRATSEEKTRGGRLRNGDIALVDASCLREGHAACRRTLEADFVPPYLQGVDEISTTVSEKPQERFLQASFATDASGVFAEAR